jgi:hypothetical protein
VSEEGSPLEEISKGATKGFLSWTKDEIIALAAKFRNRDLAFIQDPETIKLVKEIRLRSEWQLWTEYIEDEDLRRIVQSGIALRALEHSPQKIDELRSKIESKFGVTGLHQAQFVQNKILGKYINLIIENGQSKVDIIAAIEHLLINIDRHCFFIKNSSQSKVLSKQIENRLLSGINVVILFACGDAIKIARETLTKLKLKDLGYYLSSNVETDGGIEKHTLFIAKQK